MKVLLDMNASPKWVALLNQGGFETIHWSSVGLAYAPDHEIMAFAAAENYVVFTNDLDFGVILAETNAARPSVIQLRAGNLRPEVIGLRVIEAMRELRESLEAGALVTIDLKKTRMRVLPFSLREDS